MTAPQALVPDAAFLLIFVAWGVGMDEDGFLSLDCGFSLDAQGIVAWLSYPSLSGEETNCNTDLT